MLVNDQKIPVYSEGYEDENYTYTFQQDQWYKIDKSEYIPEDYTEGEESVQLVEAFLNNIDDIEMEVVNDAYVFTYRGKDEKVIFHGLQLKGETEGEYEESYNFNDVEIRESYDMKTLNPKEHYTRLDYDTNSSDISYNTKIEIVSSYSTFGQTPEFTIPDEALKAPEM